ncbi:MAG: 5'-methylthioadenosine/S-adenosylhomocysteine nucleosidase [Alphaproteobacteria bacterium]|nr:5'-methylthioadenosine/S-adenosylhomocysteine nucleosidase [Alphaproteobacteria bacterium]
MIRALFLALCALLLPLSVQAKPLDRTPRTVVMTAFAPEWDALAHTVAKPRTYKVNGLTFLTGTMAGKPVLLMQSGVSMVNAAMNTQLVLDRFTVKRIVFSGIAGGVDPALSIGDVIVAEDWAQYLEVSFARQTPQGWVVPEPVDADAPRRHYRQAVDPALLAIARKIAPGLTLRRCVEGQATSATCLAHEPKIVIGGTGVSAGVYADNAEFRDYLAKAWKARVLDMESAAVVQVAYANQVPVIVFRSLSDLAGGDAGANQMTTFMALASVNSADVVRAFVAALPD